MASEPPRSAPRIGDKVFYALCALAALLAVIGLAVPIHGYFVIEGWWSFYGIFGFVACAVMVLLARLLRLIVGRPEGYHDR